MKKRILAVLLVATMAIGLTACSGSSSGDSEASNQEGGEENDDGTITLANGNVTDADGNIIVSNEYHEVELNGITYHVADDITTEEITIQYMTFDDEATVTALADVFMELYPNITVEIIYEDSGDYETTLQSLIAAGKAPDVMMYTDADYALNNMMLEDITYLYESDDETDELDSTFAEAGMGSFSTSHWFSVPVKFFPGIMFIDQNVLETFNIETPDTDWTWSEMIDLIKACTGTINGEKYFGLGYLNRLDSYYGIASSQDIVGEFGFDGYDFDLSAWAIGEQEFSDLIANRYVAPQANTDGAEEYFGDYTKWFGETGRVAVIAESYWTFQYRWNTETYLENFDLDIIPMSVPAVSEEDASADHHTIATIDMGGLVYGTEYPREAWELLKFMSFGRDGWLTRCYIYSAMDDEGNYVYTDDSGVALKNGLMCAPSTTNEEVWDAYIEMYCYGMDDEHRALWENYFDTCKQPISYGWETIAGYYTFCVEYFNAQVEGTTTGIHNIIDASLKQASDYVDEGTRQANLYHADAMMTYFGPDGYDVLSDEEYESYQELYDANSN